MQRLFYIIIVLLFFSSCRKTEDIDNNILRLYGDALEDIGYGITRAEDGFVITGQLTEVAITGNNVIDNANSVKKMGIIRTNANGDEIWQKKFGDQAVNIGSRSVVLEDGSVVAVGYVIDKVTQLRDVYVVKTDNKGDQLTQKVYKNTNDIYNQYGVDILRTSAGFLVLGVTDAEKVGTTDSTGNEAGKKDILVMKLDNSLNEIESWSAGYTGNDQAVSIKPDNGGGYIVLATTDRSDKGPSVQSRSNILLVKINALGNFTQQRIIGGTDEENAADIEILSDGYLVVATTGTEASGQKGYAWRLSQNIFAAPVYDHIIEITEGTTPVSFRINAVSRYKTSSFVMAGQTGTGSSARMLVFLTDEEGNLLEGKMVISGGTGSQSVNDVITDDEGNIYAVGKNSYENNSMISLLKFRF
ncbi:MAG: hypothetical protein HZB98_10205 [Bacteroidia bacterium]|nr:hypothetical protein [Bacteroidia bacterium]